MPQEGDEIHADQQRERKPWAAIWKHTTVYALSDRENPWRIRREENRRSDTYCQELFQSHFGLRAGWSTVAAVWTAVDMVRGMISS